MIGGMREAMANAQKSGQFLQNIDERTELMVKRLESIGIDLDLRLNDLNGQETEIINMIKNLIEVSQTIKVITETINKKLDILLSLEISSENGTKQEMD